jgi:hypothetical protein
LRTRNALSWGWLGALVIAASCANGSSDTADDGVVTPSGDAGLGSLEAGAGDSSNTSRLGTDSGVTPTGDDDSGNPVGDDSSAPPGDDASGGEDAGIDSAPPPPVDAGHDSGSPVSVLPTTCAQTNQGTGCCYDNNNYYCNELDEVHEVKCTGGEVCGWNAGDKYYGCVNSAGSDPSGTYPIACQ